MRRQTITGKQQKIRSRRNEEQHVRKIFRKKETSPKQEGIKLFTTHNSPGKMIYDIELTRHPFFCYFWENKMLKKNRSGENIIMHSVFMRRYRKKHIIGRFYVRIIIYLPILLIAKTFACYFKCVRIALRNECKFKWKY